MWSQDLVSGAGTQFWTRFPAVTDENAQNHHCHTASQSTFPMPAERQFNVIKMFGYQTPLKMDKLPRHTGRCPFVSANAKDHLLGL